MRLFCCQVEPYSPKPLVDSGNLTTNPGGVDSILYQVSSSPEIRAACLVASMYHVYIDRLGNASISLQADSTDASDQNKG